MSPTHSANRLLPSLLSTLPSTVALPNYNHAQLKTGIVHLGVGAFHRGHQAWYTEAVLNAKGGAWGILGVSLRSDQVQRQLCPQSGLYTLVQRHGASVTRQIIGAIQNVIAAPADNDRIIEAIAAADTHIVSLTITEKGYCYDQANHSLAENHPDIVFDIQQLTDEPLTPRPRTAIGFIVAGLRRRMLAAHGGITLLSCDNLPGNGNTLKTVVLDFARQLDPELSHWILAHLSFPNSVVDRMVPATTASDLAGLNQDLGVEDQAAVFTETFSQWIIEDQFCAGRPEWELGGAIFVDNATPFEQAKLRLLNGSHSLIAYLGQLSGYQYVHQVINDDVFAELVDRYMSEVCPSLQMPAEFNLPNYRRQLLDRFANSALNHRTAQIAEDGSQKIRQRWLDTVLTDKPKDFKIHALALAGWAGFLRQVRDDGEHYNIIDPAADGLTDVMRDHQDAPISKLLSHIGLNEWAAQRPNFVALADQYFRLIQTQGSRATASAVLAGDL